MNKPVAEDVIGEVVLASPFTGCPTLQGQKQGGKIEQRTREAVGFMKDKTKQEEKEVDYRGKIVVASRGDCIFWEKVPSTSLSCSKIF